jgi:hypothetical protein
MLDKLARTFPLAGSGVSRGDVKAIFGLELTQSTTARPWVKGGTLYDAPTLIDGRYKFELLDASIGLSAGGLTTFSWSDERYVGRPFDICIPKSEVIAAVTRAGFVIGQPTGGRTYTFRR